MGTESLDSAAVFINTNPRQARNGAEFQKKGEAPDISLPLTTLSVRESAGCIALSGWTSTTRRSATNNTHEMKAGERPSWDYCYNLACFSFTPRYTRHPPLPTEVSLIPMPVLVNRKRGRVVSTIYFEVRRKVSWAKQNVFPRFDSS